MPTTDFRNLLYRCALPVLAPSPRGRMQHVQPDRPLDDLRGYERVLKRHHVLGASLLLDSGQERRQVYTSVAQPAHHADAATMFRVASITKMSTALVTLMLCDEGAFRLDDPVSALLPDGERAEVLRGVTLRQLLSHTSGLQDVPAYERTLSAGGTIHDVLADPGVRFAEPGAAMSYSNFGFGLVGCVLEQASGLPLPELYRQRLFAPLGMRATLDASTLDEGCIMPISRVLPHRAGQDVTVTALGRKPLVEADPLRHFGHSAGSMYTDAPSLATLLQLILHGGAYGPQQLISEPLIREMTTQHAFTGPASSPHRRYGLGLVILRRDDVSARPLYGHQGFAYGCVDGAFIEAETGRTVVFLNGGASEAREGRLGLVNRDLLRWALKTEVPQWT